MWKNNLYFCFYCSCQSPSLDKRFQRKHILSSVKTATKLSASSTALRFRLGKPHLSPAPHIKRVSPLNTGNPLRNFNSINATSQTSTQIRHHGYRERILLQHSLQCGRREALRRVQVNASHRYNAPIISFIFYLVFVKLWFSETIAITFTVNG